MNFDKIIIGTYNDRNWCYFSKYQKLSESFIEKHQSRVDWNNISIYQKLSESFIEKHQSRVNWNNISIYQKLSESFIEKHQNRICWNSILIYQKLSESFIEKYQDRILWNNISKYQKLSEPFIEKHQNRVNWNNISKYQKLSEPFIEKHQNRVNWYKISKYQKLSEGFIKKYNLTIISNSWLYKSYEEKLKYIKENTSYEVVGDSIIAYKSVRSDYYSVNFQHKYDIGSVHKSHCDCNYSNKDSFGLSAWTRKDSLTLNYYPEDKLLKVKIPIEKVGVILSSGKIRSSELQVLEEVEK